ncbi:mechanosensitive ion channel family protein [Aurantiacibacter luteus]|uniref:Mechanosensitive ion channel protein n=1 Tax=Aurantiacibacter luteus TaxID=1581420 RepID=A0A0G9MX51_9SPHN|nr:mechanosensitive ion channel domain-containing protein [Aurantiacibacter luteus]KLE33853.1 mechanosensitive ion channel protein [Aurantiacibacter luteus]
MTATADPPLPSASAPSEGLDPVPVVRGVGPGADAPAGDGVAGADALREAVDSSSPGIAELTDWLDGIGFTIADHRFSLWTLLVVVMVIVGVYLFARITTSLVKTGVRRATKLDVSQRLLVEKLLTVGIWALALMIGIDLLGIDLTALAVFSGAFGLAIGFGLQKTFGNLIAGIILLMDKSIKPGDVIAIADQAGNETFGQIRRIGIRAVSITTRDEREYLIPNENLMINQVENWSYSSKNVRIQVPVGIGYACDQKLAQKLMLEAAISCPRTLENPAPSVWLTEYGESSVNYTIHCWISDPEMGVGNVRSDVLMRLWDLLAENGIEIPYPQRDINLRDNAQFQQLVAAIAQRVESGR